MVAGDSGVFQSVCQGHVHIQYLIRQIGLSARGSDNAHNVLPSSISQAQYHVIGIHCGETENNPTLAHRPGKLHRHSAHKHKPGKIADQP